MASTWGSAGHRISNILQHKNHYNNNDYDIAVDTENKTDSNNNGNGNKTFRKSQAELMDLIYNE